MYRPFKSSVECLRTLNKYYPNDFIANSKTKTYVESIGEDGIMTNDYEGNIDMYSFEQAFNEFVFVDKKPFGIYKQ